MLTVEERSVLAERMAAVELALVGVVVAGATRLSLKSAKRVGLWQTAAGLAVVAVAAIGVLVGV